MTDKNGVEIKPGDYLLSKGKFKYLVKEITEERIIESWNQMKVIPGPLLLAVGQNLHHTARLQTLDLSQVEIIK